MIPTKFLRIMSAILIATLLSETVVFAGGGNPRRVPTLEELEAYQADAKAAEARLRAEAAERVAELKRRSNAEDRLKAALYNNLPVGDDARTAVLSRQAALAFVLENEGSATRRMAFRLLGENLAAALHHPARVAHVAQTNPDATRTTGPGPYRATLPTPSALSGEALDTRAEQIVGTARLQSNLAARPKPWTSGVMDTLLDGVGTFVVMNILGVGLSLGAMLFGAWGTSSVWETSTAKPSIRSLYVSVSDAYHAESFGRTVGGYETAWRTSISRAPFWSRPHLESAVFNSNEYAQLLILEQQMHEALEQEGVRVNEIEHIQYLAQAQHTGIALNIGQWLGVSISPMHIYDGDRDHTHDQRYERNTPEAQAFQDSHTSPWNHWYLSLLGYSLAFATLGFSLITAARLARTVATTRQSRLEAGEEESALLAKLAEGYAEACTKMGLAPSEEILHALRSGSLDVSLALLPHPAAADLCENFLNTSGASDNLQSAPRPVADVRVEDPAPTEQEDEDSEDTTHSDNAIAKEIVR